jgi:hypothetical protein
MDGVRGTRMLAGRRVVLAGVAALSSSAAALVSGAAIAQPGAAGHVEEVRGEVTAESRSQRRVLFAQADVFVGDDVATADSSRAAMLLGRDTSLRLGANARVRIDRFIINAGGVLTLEAGPILLDKGHANPGSTIRVRGAFGLITIRGTRVFVGPGPRGVGIFVVDGIIDVASGGTAFVLQTGEGTDIAPGAQPTQPAVWGEARIRAALASVN